MTEFTDPPPTAADLLPGMTGIPGLGVDGYTPLPIHTTFSPVLAADWHERFSSEHIAAVWPKIDTDGKVDGSDVVKMTWRAWSQHQKRAGRYVLDHLGIDEHISLSPDASVRKTLWKKGFKEELMPPVVAIFANTDAQSYRWIDAGIQRGGLVSFPISTNNTADAIAHLLSVTGAQSVMIGPEKTTPVLNQRAAQAVEQLKAKQHDVKIIPWPEDSVFESGPSIDTTMSPLPYDADSPTLILHSSGTTSLYPKPIVERQRALRTMHHMTHYARGDHAKSFGRVNFSGNLPSAHAMSSFQPVISLGAALSLGFMPRVNPPPPFTPEATLNAMIATNTHYSLWAPAMIEAALRAPSLLDKLKRVAPLRYGGGPLPPATADELKQHGIRCISIYGSTEVLCPSRWDSSGDDERPLDWNEMELNPGAGVHLRPIPGETEEGVFEIVCMQKGPFYKPSVFNDTWNDTPVYATGDRCKLTQPASDGAVRFKLLGRIDSGIVLSTGEKTNPEPIVAIVKKSKLVLEAIVFGQAKQHNGILIEPAAEHAIDIKDDQQLAAFRNAVWPYVQQANEFAPTHSLIYKEMIVVADPERPFQKTAKGSVRNGVTLDLYANEIDKCYELFEEAAATTIPRPRSWTSTETRDFVHQVVAEALRLPLDKAPVDSDLFQNLGADSLSATKIRNVITAALVASFDGKFNKTSLPSNIVYASPSVKGLSEAVDQLVAGGDATSESPTKRKEALDKLIEKYSGNWPQRAAAKENGEQSTGQHVVLVTGTTGGAGAHFLAQLAQNSAVTKIYAVNRKGSTSLKSRQEQALRSRGEDAAILADPRVELLEADTSDEKTLGLSAELYERIKDTITHVIHNAWRLDFNLSVQSFEAQIASVRNLALLCLRSPRSRAPRLLFMSSVATAARWTEPRPVPERSLDPLLSEGGYGGSKAVAETILESVRQERGIDASTIRSGQLSGSTTNGAWAVSDWVPMLLKSAQRLQCLPDLAGETAWIPTDVAVQAVLDFALSEEPSLPFALHVVNPRTSRWSDTVRTIAKEIKSDTRLVPAKEWISALESDAAERGVEQASSDNPAVKLLSFFQGMLQQAHNSDAAREAVGAVRLETEQSERLSVALRNARATDEKDVRSWIRYWRRIGFLASTEGS